MWCVASMFVIIVGCVFLVCVCVYAFVLYVFVCLCVRACVFLRVCCNCVFVRNLCVFCMG